ncbi:MAG: Ni/Fe-hydrogenase cytochrome b subunit [Deltaproteobacteria bacterium]|nr:Ni/Fe-hydrogenase cytochrome b subunit [Deltaproteobacteria bacterium]
MESAKKSILERFTFWRVMLAIFFIVGIYASAVRFFKGLGAATNMSDATPWGLWIGFDVICGVGLAAGGFIVTAVVYVFGVEKYRPILRPAILTAFMGYSLVVVGLLFDLGKPWNIWHCLIYWNTRSPLFEVAWCVMLYTTVLALETSSLIFERLRWVKLQKLFEKGVIIFVVLGVLLSTLHQSTLGTMFVIFPYKLHPLWYSMMLPILFFISCIAAGLAMVIFESFLSKRFLKHSVDKNLLVRLSQYMCLMLGIYFVVRLQDLVARGAISYAWTPSLEMALFHVEIFLGVAAPMILILIPSLRRSSKILFTASLLTVSGFIMHRLNVTITGLAGASGSHYFPSVMETFISIFLVGIGFALFGLAARYLPVFRHGEEQAVEEKLSKDTVPDGFYVLSFK